MVKGQGRTDGAGKDFLGRISPNDKPVNGDLITSLNIRAR